MNKNAFLVSAAVSMALLMAGCSSPDAKFYTLNAIKRAAPGPAVQVDGHSISVKVGPVSFPDTLDQSQIVSRSGENQLILDEYNRWIGDFKDDFQRILGENISILLPTDHVALNHDIILFPIDFQVIVNVREFNGQLGGMVTLNADWTVARQGEDKTVVARKSLLKEKATGVEYSVYVTAQSRLLEKLSQQIVDEIRWQLGQ